jgi:hypothetical protein
VHKDDRANIGEASIGNAAAKWALAGSRRRRPIVTLAERETEMHRPGIATRKMIRIAWSNKNMERQELMGCLGRQMV